MKRSRITVAVVVVVALAGLAGVKVPPEIADALDQAGVTVPDGMIRQTTGDAGPVPTGRLPATADSFQTAKRWMYDEVFPDRRKTFYCGCNYDVDRKVDGANCGYRVRADETRAARTEAEHVVPAYWIGYTRTCWREPVCKDGNGDMFKGRDCCEKADPVFAAAHNDLHNLWPAVGEINGDRSNYRFGMIEGERRAYGRCDFEVDHDLRRAEPPPNIRGDIARISFYMEQTYDVRLSRQQRQLFRAWDRQDPPDAWELERNRRIKAVQGNGNSFVEGEPQAIGDARP